MNRQLSVATLAKGWGLPVWCQDEAGPYQAIPNEGGSWQQEGKPQRQPHEYVRGGTAKLLTLFRPAMGEVRGKGVKQTTNAILHPWLKEQIIEILAVPWNYLALLAVTSGVSTLVAVLGMQVLTRRKALESLRE